MTKRLLTGFAISALLAAMPALAEQTDNTSTTIQINGVATSDYELVCAVATSAGSVSLLEMPDTLIKQGADATAPVQVHLYVYGPAEKCDSLVEAGKIAYRFSGKIDDADGTVLANSLTDDSAAKGVGVGIYDANNKPVNVNGGSLHAQKDTVIGLQMVQLKGKEAIAGNINSFVTIDIERL
ncbi:type 1 fimbrial protein [Lelliottia amnigena]|uniref:Fimbrial protein n=1 Tax=Lelliottia amnigena TaxID=61646 RepID=A0AAP2AF87_LELAM|nr:fimbrial protein [Lelliottia amnigena]MBL5900524.1 fimbrial protein [Lelliottia amnigena]MBL5936038.1 fimbrial protein [Lelliottia amnigena]TCD15818.1 type 1 fimbrial protein [Lelliottia amnigena]